MATVFVSYKSETEKESLAFVQQLEQEGIDCWIACRDIPLGADYIDEIPGAIEDCSCFLLLLSEKVETSPWIELELKQAISDGKQIFPIMMEDFELHRKYVFMLQNYQMYSVFNGNGEAFKQVVSRVKGLFPHLKPQERAKTASVPQPRPVTKPASVEKSISISYPPVRYPHTPYNGYQPYIYASYAHQDADRVIPIIHRLQDRGFRVWWDNDICPGVKRMELIADKLDFCDCVIAFLSDSFQASRTCQDEVEYARFKGRSFLPVYLEDVRLTGDLQMYLSEQQSLFRYRYASDDAFVDTLTYSPMLMLCDSSFWRE